MVSSFPKIGVDNAFDYLHLLLTEAVDGVQAEAGAGTCTDRGAKVAEEA